MIAHIIPIKRMPRTLGLLSYSIPKALEKTIDVGQLVHIPLRQSTIHGLVFSIEDTDREEELKPIEGIVHDTPLLHSVQLECIKTVADMYAISYGSAALLFSPPLQKRKLKKQEWNEAIVATQKTNVATTLSLFTTELERIEILSEVQPGSLIIVPEIADIPAVVGGLPDTLRILVWNSDLSTKEQFERWFDIRNNAYDIVVGTRTSLFLPFQTLSHIYLYREEDSSHKSWDQKPLYAVHDLLPLFTHVYGASTTYLTNSPRFDTYYHAAKGTFRTSSLTPLHAPITTPQIVNMKDERKSGNYDILSERVLQSVQATTGDILLYINRKGYATAVGCTDCDFISRCDRCGMSHVFYASTKTLRCHYCGTSARVPASCPSCHGTSLLPFGVGTEQVEAYIRQSCPAIPHTIIRIDSNQEDIPKLPPDTPVLLIGTDKVFPYVRWEQTKLVTMVQVDDQLLYPDFRAMESVWHTIRRINYQLHDTATWYIQTMQPDHLLMRSLSEPERLYRTDLSGRKQFHLPPYGKLVRLSIGKPTEFAAQTEATRVYNLLSRTLTEQGISARLRAPYTTSPTFYRGRNWYTILVTLETDSWQTDIKQIIELLPGNWRVDISPQSLLSP